MQTIGGATPLMYACQQGREIDVLNILKRQPNLVRERDRTLKTALHYCAENRNISCAEAILKVDPELVNAQDENGYSTLHLAAIAGNKPLIKLLINKGADLNVSDHEGHSAVHWAVVSSEREALELIVRAGANPSTPDVHGGYPLHYAVQMCGSHCDFTRHLEDTLKVVETLLNFEVDVNVKDKDGRQPILWAASAGSSDAIIHLVSGGACIEAADKDGLTALHCAASRGHFGTLETLVTLCGANVDVIDGNGCSALFYSVTLGHADATELLLRLGSEPNRQDRKGRTPAHCGAAKGQLETLKILQKRGGNLWLRNVKGDLPLHEAVASGRKDLVLWLLSQNPEAVNVANNDGRYPIHIACMYNNTELVKVLLDAKSLVNPIMRTSKGVLMTPLNVALLKGHRSCGKYLQLHGGVPFSKVSTVEPNSVYAVRISPSDEGINKSEAIIEALTPSPVMLSTSKTSTDGQIGRIESSDKKKVYRRRKKRKNSSNMDKKEEESDSEESYIELKVPDKELHKSRKSILDANENHSKSRSNSKSTKSSKTSSGSPASPTVTRDKKKEVVEEDFVKKSSTTKTDSKHLRKNKSFNETKNVSDLSPEDFPPSMQSIKQLDSEMLEAEIDVSKNLNEADGSLKVINKEIVLSETEFPQENVKEADLKEKEKLIQEEKLTKTEEKLDDAKEEEELEIKVEERSVTKTKLNGLESEKEEKSTKSPIVQSSNEEKDEKAKVKSGSSKEGKTNKSDASDGSEKSKKVFPKSTKTPPGSKKIEKECKTSEKKNSQNSKNGKPKNGGKIAEGEALKQDEQPKIKTEIDLLEKREEKEEGIVPKDSDEIEKSSDIVSENKIVVQPPTPDPKTALDSKIIVEKTASDSEIVVEVLAQENVQQLDAVPDIQVSESTAQDNINSIEESANGNTENATEIEEKKEESAPGMEPEEDDTEKKSEEIKPVSGEKEPESFVKDTQQDPAQEQEISSTFLKAPSPNLSETITTEILTPKTTDLNINSPEPIPTETSSPSVVGDSGSETLEVVLEKMSDDNKKEREGEIIQSNLEFGKGIENLSNMVSSVALIGEENPVMEEKAKIEGNGDSGKNKKEEAVKVEEKPEKPEKSENHEKLELPTIENSEDQNQIFNGEDGSGKEQEADVIKIKVEKKNDKDEGKTSDAFLDPPLNIKDNNEWMNGGRRHYRTPRVARLCRRHKEFKEDISQSSITQLVQNTIRKYHMERGIFYQLLELKRMQIRSGKANEQVLVKRLADEYERTRVFAGMKHFSGLYKFREFEKFLYDQLKLLNNRRSYLIPEVKSFDDIDALSGILRKSRYKLINEIPESERVCTSITHRCHHSACAYTSVPCSAYVSEIHQKRPQKQKKECFFPQIHQSPMKKPKTDESPATLELIQGNEKRVIVLPQNYPDKGKRYYVTFTIKGSSSFKDEDEFSDETKNYFKHRHAKSV